MDTTNEKMMKGEAKDDVMAFGGARITIDPSDDPFTSLDQVGNLGSDKIINYSSSSPEIEENKEEEGRKEFEENKKKDKEEEETEEGEE